MADIFDKVIPNVPGYSAGSEKQILSRMITRDISQNRYAKFYHIRTGEIKPALACFFYDIYRTVYPVRVFLQKEKNKVRLQRLAVEIFMDDAAVAAERRLSRAFVEEQKTAVPPEELIRRLKADLACFTAALEGAGRAAAERRRDLIETFSEFAGFDFLSLLRKFDPRLKDGNPAYKPQFESAGAEYLTRDLQAFLACSGGITPGEDWDTILYVFRIANGGADLIPPDRWNRLLSSLQDVKASNILTLMIQHSIGNPFWRSKPKHSETAAVSWIEIKKAEAEGLIETMSGALRQSQIAALAKTIFARTDITRLRCYNREQDALYTGKRLNGLIYAPGINYLAAFIQDYVNKEIKDLCGILLIRGQWASNALSMDMSETYYELADLEKKINAFDGSLAENGKLGVRLKTAMLRAERNSYHAAYINTILNGINAEALDMLHAAAELLDALADHFEHLSGDAKTSSELIYNWKALEPFSRGPLRRRIDNIRKKIRLFSRLIRLYTNPPEY
jgi:hypothetical protein